MFHGSRMVPQSVAIWQPNIPISEGKLVMYDYRLFYPQMSIDDQARTRRPLTGHASKRVYLLPADRRASRTGGRR